MLNRSADVVRSISLAQERRRFHDARADDHGCGATETVAQSKPIGSGPATAADRYEPEPSGAHMRVHGTTDEIQKIPDLQRPLAQERS
jgi:hypothetical protein